VCDRNHADLDWQSSNFTWRYRNRIYIVYPWCVGRYEPTPYIAAGFYYASHYNKWSDTALYAGCSLPLRKHSALSRQADFFLAFCAESSFFSPV